jgi:hypothetical protein
MTFPPSKLAQLVVAYEAHFGTQVPLEAIKTLPVIDLVSLIQDAIDKNTPLPESGWAVITFGPRGCVIEDAPPTKTPNPGHRE